MVRSRAEKSFFDTYSNTKNIKIGLLFIELTAFVVSLFYLNTEKWNLFLAVFLVLAVASYWFERTFADRISKVVFSSCLHVLAIYAIFVFFGFAEAILANTVSYLPGIALSKKRKSEVFKFSESVFVFIVLIHLFNLLMSPLKARFFDPGFLNLIGLSAAFIAHIYLESFFESRRKNLNTGSYAHHVISLGYPYYLTLLLFSSFVSFMALSKSIFGYVLAIFAWFFQLSLAYLFNLVIENQRNKFARIFEVLSSLGSRSERDEAFRTLLVEYSRKMAHEAKLKGPEFDRVVVGSILHGIGRGGIDVYSVDSIIEDIRSDWGDPLHAERAYLSIQTQAELLEVAEILKYHHKYQDKGLYTRLKRALRLQASIINVAEKFAELLTSNEDPYYDKKSAFKDLKKDSGWDFDPKAMRLLKQVLIKEGYKRL